MAGVVCSFGQKEFVRGELVAMITNLTLDADVTFTRDRVSNGIATSRSNDPIVNTSVGIMKAGANAIASVSNGFALDTPTNTGLRVACVNVRDGSMGTNGGVGVILSTSSRTLSRIVIITCNARGGDTFANSTTVMNSRRVNGIRMAGTMSTLGNGTTNIRVCANDNRPNSAPAVHVHNFGSVGTKGSPLVILSNSPCNNSLGSVGPTSMRDVAMLGSTSSATLCNTHNNGNIVLVAAGDKRGNAGNALAISTG